MKAFAVLESLYRAALSGVDPEETVAQACATMSASGIFAVGKAAAGMFRGAVRALPGARALVILPKGYPPPSHAARARVLFASHPEPDSSSVRAALEAVDFFSSFGPKETLLCLVSGGASSLLCLPRKGTTLSHKRESVRRLAATGAGIAAVNRLRTSLSAVKGGRLGRRTAARLVSLVLSDVPGDGPCRVGSGPTIRGRRRDRVLVVGNNARGLAAATQEAARRGWKAITRRQPLSGEAREEGARFARSAVRQARGSVLLAGGETTVRLTSRRGRGGRSLELALGAALELEGRPGVAILAAGSDGVDGSSRAAGAFADGTTVARARRLGLDPEKFLSRHASEAFFDRLGDLFLTGPTGTNVGDWAFALCRAREC